MKATTGATDADLQSALIHQIYDAIPVPPNLHPFERTTLKETAVAALRAIKPRDEIEGMLAVQFVATHYTVMDCFKRVSDAGQSLQIRDMNMRQAERLMTTGLRLMEALDRRCGRGPASVSVGNFLNVQPGGQAVVGMKAELPLGQTAPSPDPSSAARGHHPMEGSAPVAKDERIKRPPMRSHSDERSARRG
jgi:hypothetical protein